MPHDARTRRVLRSLAAILCPPDAAPDLLDAVIEDVELSMRAMPAAVRTALAAGLATYELGAVARWGRPASKLGPAQAARYLEFWRHGLVVQRELVKAVRSLVCFAYYEMPAVKERMRYRPDRWIEKVTRHRLATYGGDIARHAASLIEPEPLPPLSPVSPEPAPVGPAPDEVDAEAGAKANAEVPAKANAEVPS